MHLKIDYFIVVFKSLIIHFDLVGGVFCSTIISRMETTIDVSTCGLRSEPDGAPSGSNMSATGTYAATSFPKGSSDRRNPEPNSKEVEQQNNENGSQPFNLSSKI